jgi:signal transduction histidine kinase
MVFKPWASLRFRLLSISLWTTLSVLIGTGGISAWRLYQELLVSTKLLHEEVGEGFKRDLETYQEMYSPDQALDKTVEKYTRPEMQLRVVDTQGNILSASTLLLTHDPNTMPMPQSTLVPDRNKPGLVSIEGRIWIVCATPLTLANNLNIQLETLTEVTQSYQAYQSFTVTLFWAGAVSILVTTGIGWILIQRSLKPLDDICQVSASISTEDLQNARLMLKDVPTEVQNLADAFNSMLDRLSSAWSHEQQLLSNISHELRTPLSIVQGYLESTLRRGSNLTEIQTENLELSLQETQRVVRLLKDLMDLTRAEIGAFYLRIEPLVLNDLLRDIDQITSQIGSNPIQIDLPTEPVIVRADRDRLRQVLLNLLNNAVTYSPSSKPITVTLRVAHETALIQVQDQGIGIPIEHQPHIFERFYRVSTSRSREDGGIGLGLAISKALVENMKGRIQVESEPNIGTTFTISLPTAEA